MPATPPTHAAPTRVPPRRPLPPFDLANATVLFRRLLLCTLAMFCVVPLVHRLGQDASDGRRLLVALATGALILVLVAFAAVNATRLARELALSPPALYGFTAAFPCPNLLTTALLGGYLVAAWSAAGRSPLALFNPASLASRRQPHQRVPASVLGSIGTFVFVCACICSTALLAALLGLRTGPRESDTSTHAAPAARTTTTIDVAPYAAAAARGQAAFAEADEQLRRGQAQSIGFGNDDQATAWATRSADALAKSLREGAHSQLRKSASGGSAPRAYVHVRPDRAVVLFLVPQLASLDEPTRRGLLAYAWNAVHRTRRVSLLGAMQIAVGVRDDRGYGAVTIGDVRDERVGADLRTPADATPLAAFFADVRLAPPTPSPSPNSVAARFLAERQQAPLLSTPTWKAVSGDNPPREAREALTRYAAAADIEALLAASEAGTLAGPESTLAMRLLLEFALGYDARITPEQEQRLALLLRPRCTDAATAYRACDFTLRQQWADLDRDYVRQAFEQRLDATGKADRGLWELLAYSRRHERDTAWPRTIEKLLRTELATGRMASWDAVRYWLVAEPEGAERFVLGLEPRRLPANVRLWLVGALVEVGLGRDRVAQAGARLAEIAAQGGPPAVRAHKARELIGLDSQENIEARARAWRETQSRESLNRLYDYIAELPVGAPFGPWLQRLGKQDLDAGDRRSFHVVPKEGGASLYIELDENDRLFAISYD